LKDVEKEKEIIEMFKQEESIEFTNDKVRLPAYQSTKWCTSYLLPQEFIEKQHHIVGWQVLISPKENEQIVSSINLFWNKT
jgi:hypothetical protein